MVKLTDTTGYDRFYEDHRHIRVVRDRIKANNYLKEHGWNHLPHGFFLWLLTGKAGTSYLLVDGVGTSEIWLHLT